MRKRIRLTESQLHNIIRKCVNEAFKSQKLQQMYNDNGGFGDDKFYRSDYGSMGKAQDIPLSDYDDDDLEDEVKDYDYRSDNHKGVIRFGNNKCVGVKPSAYKKMCANGKTRERNYETKMDDRFNRTYGRFNRY